MPPTLPSATTDAPGAHRAARLEARLAVYAQYAVLVGDEVAAAWSADPERAGTVPRALAEERAALAEQYEALRDGASDVRLAGADGFGTVFSEAVTVLDHQAAVDRALRERLTGRWTLLGGTANDGAGDGDAGDDTAGDDTAGDDTAGTTDRAGLPVGIGGALVEARSRGVGGVLGGQFPGIAARTVFAGVASGEASGEADERSGRVDLRF